MHYINYTYHHFVIRESKRDPILRYSVHLKQVIIGGRSVVEADPGQTIILAVVSRVDKTSFTVPTISKVYVLDHVREGDWLQWNISPDCKITRYWCIH